MLLIDKKHRSILNEKGTRFCLKKTGIMNVMNMNVVVLWALAYTIHACAADKAHPRLRRSSNSVSILEFDVNSKVSMRYANVVVRSVMENRGVQDQEASFQVRLPIEAYITSFVLVIGNRTITAVIKEKAEAQKEYDQAKKDNVTAAQVSQQLTDDVDSGIFKIEVNVAANTTVEFLMEYEELIQRHVGKHKQKLYIDSHNVIPALNVNCVIKEKQKFKSLTYQTPFNETVPVSPRPVTEDEYYVNVINWTPSEEEQAAASTGLITPFEIEYELEIPETGGTVFNNNNGEFVHLFSVPCDESDIMMKQIVFVIDISGSMTGNPIDQVRAAMKTILSKLRSKDYFNIVLFDDTIYKWKSEFQMASADNIEEAKLYVRNNVHAKGSTDINSALLQAVDLFDGFSSEGERYGQIILFLTDGAPTSGVTTRGAIRTNFRDKNYFDREVCCKSTLYTIAFGENADRDFLRAIAYENAGRLIIIKDTGSNSADTEVVKVYERIQDPVYKDMVFSYHYAADHAVVPQTNVTQTQFLYFDCGNEISIGGIAEPGVEIYATVKADGVRSDVVFDSIPTILTLDDDSTMIARFAFYKLVKDYLKVAETATDPEKRKEANKEALRLSLKYGFVTPLTSLVVTDYPSTHVPEITWLSSDVSGGLTIVSHTFLLIIPLLVTVSVELTYRVILV